MASPESSRMLREYKVDTALSMPQRVAHLLDWCAKKLPGIYIPYQQVVRAVMGYEHTPRASNEEVQRLRTRMAGVRLALEKKYNRELLSQPPIGIRATVDSSDINRHKLPQRTQRLRLAQMHLQETLARVDAKELPQRTSEDRQWYDYYRSVQGAVKALESARVSDKLLSPGQMNGEEK